VFIELSLVALTCGAAAITALELGVSPREPLVKLAAFACASLLFVVGADAIVRIWRSARAWRAVDRGRAAFRIVWIAAVAIGLLAIAAGAVTIVSA
jgi:hypothetical protein